MWASHKLTHLCPLLFLSQCQRSLSSSQSSSHKKPWRSIRSLADGHAALATIFAAYDWNWAQAEREFKRAIELNPNVADIHYRYGLIYLIPVGRTDEAIREIKRALELEPLSIAMNANLAGAYMYARQNDRALEQARKTYDLSNHITARVWLANVYESVGMYNEAIALSEESFKNHMADAILSTLLRICVWENRSTR